MLAEAPRKFKLVSKCKKKIGHEIQAKEGFWKRNEANYIHPDIYFIPFIYPYFCFCYCTGYLLDMIQHDIIAVSHEMTKFLWSLSLILLKNSFLKTKFEKKNIFCCNSWKFFDFKPKWYWKLPGGKTKIFHHLICLDIMRLTLLSMLRQ